MALFHFQFGDGELDNANETTDSTNDISIQAAADSSFKMTDSTDISLNITTDTLAVMVLQTSPTTVATDQITIDTDTSMNAVPSTSSMDLGICTSTPKDNLEKV